MYKKQKHSWYLEKNALLYNHTKGGFLIEEFYQFHGIDSVWNVNILKKAPPPNLVWLNNLADQNRDLHASLKEGLWRERANNISATVDGAE